VIRRPRGTPREHVLLPIAPTPNGRLHLGHIGGPMLKLDVLARHLRRVGDRVVLVGSTDPYDSYLLLRGRETGQSPAEVVNHWHPLIERDLNAVGIVPDRFVNFLDEPWRSRNHEACAGILRDLAALGLVTVRRERFPYCTATGAFAAGGFVRGRCPECAAATAGYFCEECGLHFRPEQAGAVRCGFDDCAPEWREIPCLYTRLPDPDAVVRRMAEMGVPAPFDRIVRTYLRLQGPELRLTHPGTWGVPVPVEGSPVPQVAFTYVVCGLAFLTLSARIGAEDLGSANPPRTVTSFGYDNALPFLLGGLGLAMALPGHTPTDHMLLNHFMTLDGSKFSTSRGHVIWAGDLAGETGGDVIRAYLADTVPTGPARTSPVPVSPSTARRCGTAAGTTRSNAPWRPRRRTRRRRPRVWRTGWTSCCPTRNAHSTRPVSTCPRSWRPCTPGSATACRPAARPGGCAGWRSSPPR
jgi:methionyl-tRNA synthetase